MSSEMIGWAHGRCLTGDSGCRARLHRRLRRHTQRVTRLWRVLRTCDVSACAARRVSLHFRASSRCRWAAKRSGWCTVLFDSSTYRKVFQLLSITFSSKYTRHTHASSQNPSFRSESAACVPQPRATRPGMCRPCQRARDPLRAIARRSLAVYPRHRKRRLLRGSGKAEAAARWREATAESRGTQQCAHVQRHSASTWCCDCRRGIGEVVAVMKAHSRTLTTGKTDSTPNAWCVAPPPRPSGDLLPGAEVVQAAAGK